MSWDEDLPRKRPPFELGADLSALSIKDLEEYLSVLDAERKRAEAMIASKKSTQTAAHSVFKL
jgi:uncharacterized small protein (DUF1192 family)